MADHRSLRFVDNETGGYGAATALVAIAVGGLGTDDVAVTRLLQLATPEPLRQHGALIFGDGSLDLQKQLVIRIVRDGPVQKHDLATCAAELLYQQDLIGISPCKPVGAQYRDYIDGRVTDGIPERVQCGTVQARAAEALITEYVGLDQHVALGGCPVPQGRDLAANGLLTLLAFS